MHTKLSTLIWKHFSGNSSMLLTALALASHARDDGTSIRPGVAHLAQKTRQSERTVRRHLSELRQSGWLQTVRYRNGGRNRATEYRIDAQWIETSANLTPFGRQPVEKVPTRTIKDDSVGIKRMSLVSPQQPRTMFEPTTTPSTVDTGPVVTYGPLIIPTSAFPAHKHVSVRHILLECPLGQRQNILDEVAGLFERGKVRHPVALLQALADRAVKGEFVPDAALDYQFKRERQLLVTRSNEQAKIQTARDRIEVEDGEAARTHLAAMKEMLLRTVPSYGGG
ncbi:hypothetical protein D3C71_1130310 [compost metagenome]